MTATDHERRLGLDRWDLLAAVAVGIGLLALHLPASNVGIDDPAIYLQMARDPLGALPPAPFRFRVGTPILVSLLPMDVATGFLVVTWAALTGTALVVRRTATALADEARGLAAMGLLIGAGGVVGTLRLPYATEPMSLLAGAGALELGRRRRWGWAGLVLAFGALHRETTLFVLLPLLAWLLVSVDGRRARLRAAAVLVGPGAVTYLVLHKTPLLYGTVPGERLQSPIGVVAWNLATPGGFGQYLIGVVLGSIGLLWAFLPAVYRRQGPRAYLSCTLLLLVPLAVGCATATDWPRILGYAIVVAAVAVAVVAPARILAPLVAGQAAFGILIALDLVWAGLAAAVLTAVMVVALLVRGADADDPPLLTTAQLRGRPGLLAGLVLLVVAVGFPLGGPLHDLADRVFTPITVDRALRRSTTRALERLRPSIGALPDVPGAEPAAVEPRYNCTAKGDDPVAQPELRRRWDVPASEAGGAASSVLAALGADGWTTSGTGVAHRSIDDDTFEAAVSTTADGRQASVALTVRVADVEPCDVGFGR